MTVSLGGVGYSFMGSTGQVASSSVSADPSAGATIVVGSYHFVAGGSSDIVSSVTDNAGNSYALAPNTRQYNNGVNVEIWYAYNVNTTAGLITTVNYLNPAQTNRTLRVAIIEGASTTNPLDLSSGSTQNSVTTATDYITTGIVGTPTTDGQFVFSMLGIGNSPDNINPGTGYTAIGSYVYNNFNRAEYLIQTSAASVAGTYTVDLAGGGVATSVATFKAAGVGGGSLIGKPTRIDQLGTIQTRIGPSERNVFYFNV
jgi:hypothetical protein